MNFSINQTSTCCSFTGYNINKERLSNFTERTQYGEYYRSTLTDINKQIDQFQKEPGINLSDFRGRMADEHKDLLGKFDTFVSRLGDKANDIDVEMDGSYSKIMNYQDAENWEVLGYNSNIEVPDIFGDKKISAYAGDALTKSSNVGFVLPKDIASVKDAVFNGIVELLSPKS